MVRERSGQISKERFAELKERFYLDEGGDFMTLDLGKRMEEDAKGYPVLSISTVGGKNVLSAEDFSEFGPNLPGRDLTIPELVTFFLVAKKLAPEAEMTKRLEAESKIFLGRQRGELKIKLNEIDGIINTIFS